MSSVLEQIIAQSGTSALCLGTAQLRRLRQLTCDSADLVLDWIEPRFPATRAGLTATPNRWNEPPVPVNGGWTN